MFSEKIINDIKAHALDQYPNESCGFIVDEEYISFDNLADKPKESFVIQPEAWAKYSQHGTIKAVVHSHPDGPDCPSEADMRQQVATDIPWGIICTNGEQTTEPFWFGDDAPKAPLIGRGFRHGVTDCYSQIRDYYLLERKITLPEFPRDWEWWLEDQDLYQDGFAIAGFKLINESEVKEGDVFLAQVRSKVPNHGGVYLGNGLGLHHLTGALAVDMTRLSVREPINRWNKFITHWLRYDA